MDLDEVKTVRAFVAENPAATRVFERYGIDYCCGGNKTIRTACEQANISLQDVLRSLTEANGSSSQTPQELPDFQTISLSELIAHILTIHHEYVKREMPRIKQLSAKVVAVHCQNHPELAAVQRTFHTVAREFEEHMMKEELMLFPYIQSLEQARNAGKSLPPALFGSLSNPVRVMEMEHESAGATLEQIRKLTGGYTPPADACFSYRTLFAALEEFEMDLHHHVHLENNVLFPRDLALEGQE